MRAARLAGILLLASTAAAGSYRIETDGEGAFGVGFQEFADVGAEAPWPVGSLVLTQQGRRVSFWVDDADGDDAFGPGDRLEFVGERLRGERSFHHPHSRYNVYLLHTDGRAAEEPSPPPDDGPVEIAGLAHRRRMEADRLMLRLRGAQDDSWYWEKLTPLRKRPFPIVLDLGLASFEPGGRLRLVLELRGWSSPVNKKDATVADHRVELTLDGRELASEEWNGTELHRMVVETELPGTFRAGENRIGLQVPSRRQTRDGQALVDVVLLNSIEVSVPVDAHLKRQLRLFPGSDGPAPVRLLTDRPGLRIFTDRGERFTEADLSMQRVDGRYEYRFEWPAGVRRLDAAPEGTLLSVNAVSRYDPRPIVRSRAADYLMIAHSSLRDAVAPLAAFHRDRGLFGGARDCGGRLRRLQPRDPRSPSDSRLRRRCLP